MSDKNAMGHWDSNQTIFPKDDDIGFVYFIKNKSTNEFYIGCKLLKKKITRPPLKGKKRRRIQYIESDWKTYCGSSGAHSDDIRKNKDNYLFCILSFHKTKTSMKIHETEMIIKHIYNPCCLNECVNIRLRVNKSARKGS